MKLTKAMRDRESYGMTWVDEGNGYASTTGYFRAQVVYVALPKGHPLIGLHYDLLKPDVNGGLTFGNGNVYGWDYGHACNSGSPEEHIRNAIAYFKKWARCCGLPDKTDFDGGFCERKKGHKGIHARKATVWENGKDKLIQKLFGTKKITEATKKNENT